MSVSRLIDVNWDVKIDAMVVQLGRKGLKLIHMYEIMIPSRGEWKDRITEFSPKMKEIAVGRHPDWFPPTEEEKKAIEEKKEKDGEMAAIEGPKEESKETSDIKHEDNTKAETEVS